MANPLANPVMEYEYQKLSKTNGEDKSRWQELRDVPSFGHILYMCNKKNNYCIKISWLIIVLMAIAGFGTVTVFNAIKLNKRPISTSITLTRQEQLDFPAVTICSLSIFDKEKLTGSISNVDIISDLNSIFLAAENNDSDNCITLVEKVSTKVGVYLSYGELVNILRNNFTELLSKCSFVNKKCTSSDFHETTTTAGICYTFNANGTFKTTGTGQRQGLRLELNNGNQVFSLTRDNGYRVIIHNPDEPPRPEAEGIVIPPNFAGYIGLKQVKSNVDIKFSPTSYQCEQDQKKIYDGDLSINRFDFYSASLCESACFYEFMANKCGCVEPSLYALNSGKYTNFSNCTVKDLCCEVQNFFNSEIRCDHCLPRCNSVDHVRTVSYSTTYIEDNSTSIFVYFESLVLETRETTNSYDVWSLISDIGGNTGLFLGFTLLTGAEFLFFLFSIFKDCCRSFFCSGNGPKDENEDDETNSTL